MEPAAGRPNGRKSAFPTSRVTRSKSAAQPLHYLLLAVGTSSIVTFLASAYSIGFLKLVAVSLDGVATYIAIRMLMRAKREVVWKRALPLFLLFSIYPLASILVESIHYMEVKRFTDGFAIIGPYYMLPVFGLAALSYAAATKVDVRDIIFRYTLWMSPVIVAGFAGGYYSLETEAVAGVYTIYDNWLIPASLLLLVARNRQHFFVALGALVALAAMAAMQGSRSYMLVLMYIISLKVVWNYKSVLAKVVFLLAMGIGALVVVGMTLPSSLDSSLSNEVALVKKVRADSLATTLEEFLETGDVVKLFYWDGNSRAGILEDAFSNFSVWDWFFGRGVFAKYQSFVERNTIEVGIAQEIFWFGLVYVIPLVVVSVFSLRHIYHMPTQNDEYSILCALLGAVILIRLLDSIVYGVPRASVYALLFWMALMSLVVRRRPLLNK